MKIIKLLSKSSNKVSKGCFELFESDIENLPSGMIPGEWVYLVDPLAKKKYVAFVNPHQDVFSKIKIITSVDFDSKKEEHLVAEEMIVSALIKALKKREMLLDYQNGCRLVYGASDFLPGLIVDKYKKYILIQINTAGLDRFRTMISEFLKNNFPHHEIILYDNDDYRKAEFLPTYEKNEIGEDLEVNENGFEIIVPKNILQKIGYYYDHRENRSRLKSLLLRLQLKKETGLDLFSYVGSWGLHLLSSGVKTVDFVDQGQMQEAVLKNLERNQFIGRGQFIRSDVFKFLDLAIAENKKYDVIVSDPPAFTKSLKNKPMALSGYEKLHLKAMKLLNNDGVFVAASCTHYVSYDELDKTIQDAAFKNNQRLHLLDLGKQGFDHPSSGINDKSFYIKYLVYYVSRG